MLQTGDESPDQSEDEITTSPPAIGGTVESLSRLTNASSALASAAHA
jgi:hypothetical protein